MPEAEIQKDRIGVLVAGRDALLLVDGRGSYRVGASVKEFGRAIPEEGVRRLVFDLGSCIGMDSTFMGILAGLALFYSNLKPSGAVVMVHVSEKNGALLKTLGIDRLVSVYPPGAEPEDIARLLAGGAEALQTLPRCDETTRQTTSTMLEAHETLVRASPENHAKFKDVLAFLREDLKREDL